MLCAPQPLGNRGARPSTCARALRWRSPAFTDARPPTAGRACREPALPVEAPPLLRAALPQLQRAIRGPLDVALHHPAASPVPCTREYRHRSAQRLLRGWCSGALPPLPQPRQRFRARAVGAALARPLGGLAMTPSTSPTFTSSPSLRSIRLNTPAAGAGTSRSIFRSRARRRSPATRCRPVAQPLEMRASTWTHRLRDDVFAAYAWISTPYYWSTERRAGLSATAPSCPRGPERNLVDERC